MAPANTSTSRLLHTFCFLSDVQFGLYEMLGDTIQHWSKPMPIHQHFANLSIKLRHFDAHGIAERERDLLTETVNTINHLETRPDFLVHGGDMVNFSNRHTDFDAYQSILSACNIQKHIYIPGNHDICIPQDKFTTLSPKALKYYKQRFGPDYHAWIQQSIGYVCLNGSIYFHNDSATSLRRQQNVFLQKSMEAFYHQNVTQIIVFCHQPLLYSHAGKVTQPEKAHEVIDVLSDFSSYPIQILSGHDHRYHSTSYQHIKQYAITSVGCTFGNHSHGFAHVYVYPDHIHIQRIELPVGKNYFRAGPMRWS